MGKDLFNNRDWRDSYEFDHAYDLWYWRTVLAPDEEFETFELSQEFRNARAAYRRRINGSTKADH